MMTVDFLIRLYQRQAISPGGSFVTDRELSQI